MQCLSCLIVETTAGLTWRRCQDTLIEALSKRKEVVNDLTVVSNNVGSGDKGLGKLLYSGQIGKVMASYIGGYAF